MFARRDSEQDFNRKGRRPSHAQQSTSPELGGCGAETGFVGAITLHTCSLPRRSAGCAGDRATGTRSRQSRAAPPSRTPPTVAPMLQFMLSITFNSNLPQYVHKREGWRCKLSRRQRGAVCAGLYWRSHLCQLTPASACSWVGSSTEQLHCQKL